MKPYSRERYIPDSESEKEIQGGSTKNYEFGKGLGVEAWRERLNQEEDFLHFFVMLQRKDACLDQEHVGRTAEYLRENFDNLLEQFDSLLDKFVGENEESNEFRYELLSYGGHGVFLKGILSGFHPELLGKITEEDKKSIGELLKKSADFLIQDSGMKFSVPASEVLNIQELEEQYHEEREVGSAIYSDEQLADLILLFKKNDCPVESEFFLDLLERAPAGSINYEVAQVLSQEKSGEHAQELLDRVRNTDDKLKRDVYSRVLYYMELGKVGVSENVVKYLDMQYELQGGDFKADFARRITGDGKVGLFDENGNLLGYFDLGDLSQGDKKRDAEVLEVSRQLLFFNTETPDEIRTQFLQDYTHFYEDAFGEVGGVRLNDLTLREQVWMYEFWKGATEKEWQEAVRIKEDHGLNGVKIFQALESSQLSAKTILSFAEKTKEVPQARERVFHVFAGFLDSIDTDAEEIVGLVEGVLEDDVSKEYVKKALLETSASFVKDIEEKIEKGEEIEKIHVYISVMENNIITLQQKRREVMKELRNIKEDIGGRIGKNADVLKERIQKKLEKIIYGFESEDCSQVFADVKDDVQNYEAEIQTREKPLYFPVGISRNLPEWEKVFQGHAEATKPVEIFGYLFWLDNQGQPVELVIADTVQVPNYMQLYGMSETEAREKAIQVGNAEAKMYQEIIEKFGLTNISIRRYDEMKSTTQIQGEVSGRKKMFQETGKTTFDYYHEVCKQLREHPLWKQAFVNAAGVTSVEGVDTAYATDEIAYILSQEKIKVSHMNEALYDAVALVLHNIEQRLEEKGYDLFDLMNIPLDIRTGEITEKQKEIAEIVNGVKADMIDVVNIKKNDAKTKRSERIGSGDEYNYRNDVRYQYMEKFATALKGIESVRAEKKKATRGEKKSEIDFDVVVPSVDAQSFGWAVAEERGVREVMRFREPYSTYFFTEEETPFLSADQVIASKGGHIGGKVLAMSGPIQEMYAKKVLRPLCVEYLQKLKSAPEKYFTNHNKSRDDIQNELEHSKTIKDLLDFIQNNIIR